MGVEGEAADDEEVEADAAHGFFGGFADEFGADGAVFGADADGDAAGAVVLGVGAFGMEVFAGVGFEASEDEFFAFDGVLDAGLVEVVDDGEGELAATENADARARDAAQNRPGPHGTQ